MKKNVHREQNISLFSSVSNVGVTFDPSLTFDNHIKKLCKSSFYHLKKCCIIYFKMPLFPYFVVGGKTSVGGTSPSLHFGNPHTTRNKGMSFSQEVSSVQNA